MPTSACSSRLAAGPARSGSQPTHSSPPAQPMGTMINSSRSKPSGATGRRYFKWDGYDSNDPEALTWEPGASLAHAAALERYQADLVLDAEQEREERENDEARDKAKIAVAELRDEITDLKDEIAEVGRSPCPLPLPAHPLPASRSPATWGLTECPLLLLAVQERTQEPRDE